MLHDPSKPTARAVLTTFAGDCTVRPEWAREWALDVITHGLAEVEEPGIAGLAATVRFATGAAMLRLTAGADLDECVAAVEDVIVELYVAGVGNFSTVADILGPSA